MQEMFWILKFRIIFLSAMNPIFHFLFLIIFFSELYIRNMKRLSILIFIASVCFVISEDGYAFSYPTFSNSSTQKTKEFHFYGSNCPNNEIELGYQFSQLHCPADKFKKLTCSLPLSFTTFNHLFYQITGIISLHTFFIPTSRLLIFPFHNFW